MEMERILITGCGGMLGSAVYPYFASPYKSVLATDKNVTERWLEKLDVRDEPELIRIFRDYKPNFVIHLAAETDLEFCETHKDIAEDTNSQATKFIAQLAEKYGSLLIYISTAGVFDGLKEGIYTEGDRPNPIMVYGRTKYDGELHVQNNCSRAFIVRAGWMMGGGRKKEKKFIYKILKQIDEGKKEIFAVNDKWGTPTYALDFAMNLDSLIKTHKYGTYHMVCEGKGTRYDVAKELLNICKRSDLKLSSVDSDFFKQDYFAARPASEMMVNTRLHNLGINYMRPWENVLKEYIESFYSDYISWEISSKSSPVSPEQKQSIMPSEYSERRGEERFLLPNSFEYTLGTNKDNKFLKVITLNQSESGLGIYMFHSIEKGQTVKIINEADFAKEKEAIVRWVKEVNNKMYKAGLMFI